MTLKQLTVWVREQSKNYPNLKSEISDYYELCLNEIYEGGSEQHEVNLCISSIEDLIDMLKQFKDEVTRVLSGEYNGKNN